MKWPLRVGFKNRLVITGGRFDKCLQNKVVKNKEARLRMTHARRASRGARIRTWDPLVPNQVHYRTVLHPEL
jgi:hypothetical protein